MVKLNAFIVVLCLLSCVESRAQVVVPPQIRPVAPATSIRAVRTIIKDPVMPEDDTLWSEVLHIKAEVKARDDICGCVVEVEARTRNPVGPWVPIGELYFYGTGFWQPYTAFIPMHYTNDDIDVRVKVVTLTDPLEAAYQVVAPKPM